MTASPTRDGMETTLVLGLGNILCGDEGIGCRLVEYLYATADFPKNVILNDGGTMGQELLGRVLEADNLLIIDCADFGKNAGEATIIERASLPIWLGAGKMSPHQASFAEVLALAKLKDGLPEKIALLAIQPQKLEFGEALSPLLADRIKDYAELALSVLSTWGIEAASLEKTRFLNNTPTGIQFCESAIARSLTSHGVDSQ